MFSPDTGLLLAVFGIIRPCRHRLGSTLGDTWRAHLCGVCLSLRDDHGQLSRIATNYDGLIISILAEAQSREAPGRRVAGPCPLRGMRRASVATGDCARLAACVSLVLAAAKIRDHAADGDGVLARPGLRAAASGLARGWETRGAQAGRQVSFDTTVLTAAVGRQDAIEAAAGPGTPLLTITEPTETATGAAFAHTALLAERPENTDALEEAGRLFGRIAHLVDAVEDLAEDAARGAWNPLAATGASVTEARRLCEDAHAGIRLALADAEFTDRALVDALLGAELRRAIRRVFADSGRSGDSNRSSRSRSRPGPPYLLPVPDTDQTDSRPKRHGCRDTWDACCDSCDACCDPCDSCCEFCEPCCACGDCCDCCCACSC